MLSVNELKAELVRNGETVKSISRKMGVASSTFHKKMNGVSDFTRSDMEKIVGILNLSNADAMRIFFADDVV